MTKTEEKLETLTEVLSDLLDAFSPGEQQGSYCEYFLYTEHPRRCNPSCPFEHGVNHDKCIVDDARALMQRFR
jgi:hypothetical protein